ncbi:MAG: hypothetical protein KatS3mg010_1896 [Acidimicrobiia bacterium]|nr:MAG: hypothetical protein KatS3mg010_1896 [Acidimicrobiia bacterium]
MPEHLRAGVGRRVARVRRVVARGARSRPALDRERVRARLERWRRSPLDPIRQYVRLLESLVLFAEHELQPAAAS